MNFSGSKKIILLGIILLIIAGIVVVALKGVNVSLILQQHESINLLIGKEVERKDIKDICKEVFQNKNVVVRNLELFDDSVNISVESITDEEKNDLVQKINEKYGTTFTSDDLTIQSNSNIRVRDLVRLYVKPVIISVILIIVYMIIRFRKVNALKLLGKIFGIVILTEALIASIIAIVRVPLSPVMINLMAVVAVVELIIYINKQENSKLNVQNAKK